MKYFAIFAAVLGVAVALPASGQVWTLQQLSDALENPSTNPSVIPYLEKALNALLTSLIEGNNASGIMMNLPGVMPAKPTPVIPEVVAASPATSGPLVQLIINVNSKNEVAAPEIDPTPVDIVESPEFEEINVGPVIVENPVIINPVDSIHTIPAPVIDGDFGIIV